MKRVNIVETFPLTPASVDQIAEMIEEFLTSLKVERANLLRIRLSMEEALLRWMSHFSAEDSVHLSMTMKHRRPTIVLELRGEACDPTSAAEDELGEWASGLLSGVGLTPLYSYIRGVNTLTLTLNRRQLNPALMLLISILLGTVLGVLGDAFMTDDMRGTILRVILDPVQTAYFRFLNVASGPVVFLSVLAAICSVGSMTAMGRHGKHMITRFILLSTIMSLLGITAGALVFRVPIQLADFSGSNLTELLNFSLGLIPSDILTPLISGDSPQLILLAVILGCALLVSGEKTGGLTSIVNQGNTLCLTLAEWVSRLTPLFVTLLLILGIWDGSMWMFLDIWKPLALYTAISLIYMTAFLVTVSVTKGVSIVTLVKKIAPSFLLAFKNASVDAAFGENQSCCERKLGVSKALTEYGLPVGLVLFMPSSILATTLFSLYAANVSGVSISILWLLICSLLAVALQTATPPVAGVDLLAYAAIFGRLGVPTSALTLAIVADILFTFATSAFNQAMLQMDLVQEAGRMGLLDSKRLRSGK